MMNRIYQIFMASLLISCVWSCDPGTSGTNTNEPGSNVTVGEGTGDNQNLVPTASADQKVIPGHRVGLILADATEADIIKAYGEENVKRLEIGIGEDEMRPGTLVFPGTDKELMVEWQDKQVYQKIWRIRIEQEKAPWTTLEGVHIGSSLDELQRINGKDFEFHGFEWDYSGMVNNWNGGAISKNLEVFLTPGNMEAVFPDLLGDSTFPSSHPKAKNAELKVTSLIVKFDHDTKAAEE